MEGVGGMLEEARLQLDAKPDRSSATLIRVRRHSMLSITTSMAAAWMKLVTMATMVLLMAVCAPTTSLFRRLINSPTRVLVKKRSDMRCKRE